MLSRKITLILFILIFLQGITSAGTVTCDGETWTCDGTADQVEIQTAINEGDSVSLSGSFVVSAPIIVDSNTILSGDGETIIKLKDHAGWKKFRGMFEAIGCENITVYGFEVDGNEPNQNEECGACYYTIFVFDGSSDLVFHDLYLHDNCNDGIRVFNTESKDCNLEVYDCTFERCYHNGVYLHKANGAKIYNNKFVPRTNAGICATDSNHLSIHDNVVDTGTPPTGGAGFEIQKTASLPMDDIEIYNNKISNTNLPGIWLYGYNAYPADSAKDVYIHDNTITGCGMGRGTDHYYGGGVVVQGFNNTILENNIIKDNYNEGVTLGNVYSNPPNYNYITVMKGNTISGTIASTYKSGKDLSVSSTYGYVSDGKIPEHDEEEDTTDDDNKDGDGEGEEDVVVVPPEDNETDDNPDDDYYEPEPAREFEMDSIFDVLDMEFSDTGITDQSPEDFSWTIKAKEKGRIKGRVEIVGYKNKIWYDGQYYVSSPDDLIVKTQAVKNPDFFWAGESVERIDKILSFKTENGITTAYYNVTLYYERTTVNRITGEEKTKHRHVTSVFKDSIEALPVLERRTNTKAHLEVFKDTKNPLAKLTVAHSNLTQKIIVTYGDDMTIRRFLFGEVCYDEGGLTTTVYSKCDRWDGTIKHSGEVFILPGKFDPDKLHIEYFTPYDSSEVEDITVTYHKTEEESYTMKILKILIYLIMAMVAGYEIMKTIIT